MKKENQKDQYFEGIGRRKTSTARVRIRISPKTTVTVNEKNSKDYFQTEEERRLILDPLIKGLGEENDIPKFSIEVKISGGGMHSQAEAVSLGLARALCLFNNNFRGSLKLAGYLKRDARAKERRKFGLKKARKAPKWSKR